MVTSVVFVAGMVVQRALNGHRYDTLQHDGIKMPSLHCNAGKKGASEIYRPKSYCAKQKMAKLGQGTFFAAFGKGKASEEGIVLCLWAAAGAPTRE